MLLEAVVGPAEGANFKVCHAGYIQVHLVGVVADAVDVLEVDSVKIFWVIVD
jgi:hypothetical protein